MHKILNKKRSRGTQAAVPTFAGQFGGGEAQSEHRAVGDQSVFQLVDPFVTHRVMAEVQSLQTLGAGLKQQRRMKSFGSVNRDKKRLSVSLAMGECGYKTTLC